MAIDYRIRAAHGAAAVIAVSRGSSPCEAEQGTIAAVFFFQLLVGIYGGYFGQASAF